MKQSLFVCLALGILSGCETPKSGCGCDRDTKNPNTILENKALSHEPLDSKDAAGFPY